MRLLIALVVGAFVVASSAAGARTAKQPLAWAPPVLSNPVSISVTNANSRLFLDNSRDYRLTIAETLNKELWIDGGRNVVVIGGHINIDQLGNSDNSYQDNTAIKVRFGDPAGTVHLEGLLVDGPYVSDGIGIATGRNVQIENVRVERVYDIKGGHADCVQVQQGVRQLRMDRFTCSTANQGIYLGDLDGPIRGADLKHVNMYAAGGKHLFFQVRPLYPVALADVWLDADACCRPWAPFGFWVYPQKDGRTYSGQVDRGRRAVVSRDRKMLWFVGSRISGFMRKGTPPSGDFVPGGSVGMMYVSPGYRFVG